MENPNPSNRLLIHQMPFRVNTANTDMHKRLRPGAMLAHLIQSSIQHSERLQAGFETLSEQNLFWVLSRISIDIHQPLEWHEEAFSETWPKNLEKIMYLRDFRILGADEKLFASASSGWLAIDKISKRPKLVNQDYSEIFTALKERHALTGIPEKLNPVKTGDIHLIKSTYFDIDLNGHVTSSRYIDWMMDTFEVDFHQTHYPRSISVNYFNETKIGEDIELRKTADSERVYSFEGFNKSRNVIAFLGKVGF